MAKKTKKTKKGAKPPRRLGFGRREKLVVIGVLGILGVGALHFVVFKPGVSRVTAAAAEYQRVKSEYQSGAANYNPNDIQSYREATETFADQLYQILSRERLDTNALIEFSEPDAFRERVRRLSDRWLRHQRTRGEEETNLTFIAPMQTETQQQLQQTLQRVGRGQFTWNLPDGLPEGVTESVIADNLRIARGKLRLISMITRQAEGHQNDLNTNLRQLGIPVFLLGIDTVTFPEEAWRPYVQAQRGLIYLEGGPNLAGPPIPREEVNPYPFRLPNPVDAFCALAHVEMLLDALYPPPFDAETMERAHRDPASLSDEQRAEFEQWREQRRVEREGDPTRNFIGLEELLSVTLTDDRSFYTPALDSLDRMIAQAIEIGLGNVLQVHINKPVGLKNDIDPWNPPEEEETDEQEAGPMMGRMDMYGGGGSPVEGGMPVEMMGMEGAAMYGYGYEGMMQQQQQQTVEEDAFAFSVPVFIQVTGTYTDVMEYFLWLSQGPNFYRVEDVAIYNSQRDGTQRISWLPDDSVIGDFWVGVPVYMGEIDSEWLAQKSEERGETPGG